MFTFASVYTGYLDVDQGAKHMFFYFFESRRDPAKGISLITYLLGMINLDILDR